MKWLKNKIWEDIKKYSEHLEEKGDYSEKELHHVFMLTHTWLNICNIEKCMTGSPVHTHTVGELPPVVWAEHKNPTYDWGIRHHHAEGN